MNIKLVVFSIFLASLSSHACATDGSIGPVFIESVSSIALAKVGYHVAGNLEVKIKGDFPVPTGLNCVGPYITTLKSVDSEKLLFALVTIAQTKKQPVNLRITDDPAYTAYPGRCSLVYVELTQ